MNPHPDIFVPDEHLPMRQMNNSQLTYVLARTAAIRNEAGFIATPGGAVRRVRMTVSLGVAVATFPVPAPQSQPCAE